MALSFSIEYEWFLDRSIWLIDGILTGTTTPVQSGTERNNYEEMLHTS